MSAAPHAAACQPYALRYGEAVIFASYNDRRAAAPPRQRAAADEYRASMPSHFPAPRRLLEAPASAASLRRDVTSDVDAVPR